MKRPYPFAIAALLVLLLGGLIGWHQWRDIRASQAPGHLVLLIPDNVAADAPVVRLWLDAASEVGVPLRALTISRWVRGNGYDRPRPDIGVIVPDTYHRSMGDAAITMLRQHVSQGGKLMLVGDAGLLDTSGTYPSGPSRLSQLAGIDYGDYRRLGDGMTTYGDLQGSSTDMEALGIPPGRYLSSLHTLQEGGDLFGQQVGAPPMRVSGYTPDLQRFAHLVTRGTCAGKTLLRTQDGSTAACLNPTGRGETLFVNLPLTYLKQRTDGVFLHGFLNYFAQRVVGLPTLSPSPNGVGTVVLNWHSDDRRAEAALRTLQAAGIFDHGHQSFHFTAGPDVNVEGDGLGMDLSHNAGMLAIIEELRAQGHAMGSHGGWIHNHFGFRANDNNGDEMEPLLALNHEAVTRANGGVPPREYSAPVGNHPLWTNAWTAAHGIIGYYTVSNVGMGPTRMWIGERRVDNSWAFPVTTAGPMATAEDAYFQKVPADAYTQWLLELGRFVEQQHAIRLVYFHPPGAVTYLPSVKAFVEHFQGCVERQQCQWATMTEAADFLNRRLDTQWALLHVAGRDALEASHPESLVGMTWYVPKSTYATLELVEGQADISQDEAFWRVRVSAGKRIKAWLTPHQPAA